MNHLKEFLNRIEDLITSENTAKKLKKKYCKISEDFLKTTASDQEIIHLLEPLKKYFFDNDKIFMKKKKPQQDEVEEFLDGSDMLVTFWKDTFDDFDILIKR